MCVHKRAARHRLQQLVEVRGGGSIGRFIPRRVNAATAATAAAAALIPPRNEVEKIIGPRVTP